MRIVDADILSYSLYDGSPAHEAAWSVVQRGIEGKMELNVTPTTILEAYNTLFWGYRVRPLRRLLEKLTFVVEGMRVVNTAPEGLRIAESENMSLGDGFMIATALREGKPVLVTNDEHLIKAAQRHGLITENPIPAEVRKKLTGWRRDATDA